MGGGSESEVESELSKPWPSKEGKGVSSITVELGLKEGERVGLGGKGAMLFEEVGVEARARDEPMIGDGALTIEGNGCEGNGGNSRFSAKGDDKAGSAWGGSVGSARGKGEGGINGEAGGGTRSWLEV